MRYTLCFLLLLTSFWLPAQGSLFDDLMAVEDEILEVTLRFPEGLPEGLLEGFPEGLPEGLVGYEFPDLLLDILPGFPLEDARGDFDGGGLGFPEGCPEGFP